MTETSSPPALTDTAVVLTDPQREEVALLAGELGRVASGVVDSAEWLAAARDVSVRLPRRLRSAAREFRHHAGPDGVLLVRNLPVPEGLPATPTRPGSVQRTASPAAAAMAAVMLQLGEVIAYRSEKSGALVQDVVPVPGRERQQSNAGSVRLQLHTENAFHHHRPDYVGLLCVREDPTGDARLCTASIRRALPMLSRDARQVLSEQRFMTEPPPSFGGSGSVPPPVHSILRGAPEDPDVLVDFASTHPLDDGARRAMEELRTAFGRATHALALSVGDLAVVDNRLTVHGRTSFAPRYDGTDRWLHRVYAVADHRRSRAGRPGGGSVLD
ncbi:MULTISPECIES: TauD/TfdA family dioxygenase [unclassified Streptomyces]|uniref:TauD/TfdA family dioxygenase n=1 Tax=unclassified Streptomyces TaxID=2593676 RepID=UPI000880AECD|nr:MULTISPECIES: TauD/TfdA family dioxygenase [unclassified Streptomyces]PBC83959.1 L-asparagine oxygenase [Streptomyces sp. 2321.6]SDR36677.1 L-asparagine oxygenase [Streptomyces sp. KS_16]SED14954.1 L-asparagine oxygenase [Streptomyces sp. 2133.1]SEE64672.1 L-asparagine oxygenase [Streptomyces sp. 2112.3]SNC70038.1 L-asparagine oxygenase [Streptomyces sp. 2114.4]